MSSTNKTDLGFNKWVLSDKPTMQDFNADNVLVDELFSEHEEQIVATIDTANYAKTEVEKKLFRSHIVPGGLVTQFRDVVSAYSRYPEVKPTGALLITLKNMVGNAELNINVSGDYYSSGTRAPFSVCLYGVANMGIWNSCFSHCHTGVMRNDRVRYGYSVTTGHYYVVLGDVADIHSYDSAVLDKAWRNLDVEMEFVATLPDGITFTGGTHYANTLAPSIAHPTWNNLTLQNGATGTLSYVKAGHQVTVQGRVVRNAAGTTLQIATLPAGYRPKNNYVVGECWTTSDGPAARVSAVLAATGALFMEQNGSGTLMSSTPYYFYIQYIAEQ